jgi:hypothetical protein
VKIGNRLRTLVEHEVSKESRDMGDWRREIMWKWEWNVGFLGAWLSCICKVGCNYNCTMNGEVGVNCGVAEGGGRAGRSGAAALAARGTPRCLSREDTLQTGCARSS